MKKISFFKYAMLFVAAITLLGFNSCKDDDDDDDPDPIFVEDGLYVKGDGTTFTELNIKGMLTSTPNEADANAARTGLLNIYVAVKAGSEGFNLVQVAGNQQTVWGPGATFDSVPVASRHQDEPRGIFWRGALETTETAFIVPEDGLYHVAVDLTLGTVALAKVEWGLIGGATPGGWGSNTVMTAPFDLETMTFTVEDVAVEVGEFKYRYSNGWKIFMDAPDNTVSVNTNFGKAVDDLEPGGANIANTERGVYKFTMKWTAGEAYEATMEKTGDLAPAPEYPEAMYLVGAATAYAWDAPGGKEDAVMHKIAGGAMNEGVYWKIAHLAGGEGFKLSAANWSDPNLGHAQVTEFDAEGVAVTDVEGNMSVADSGMYLIVLDLRDDKTMVSVRPAAVYGIGDAFGGWDAGVEANKFTVDNTAKTITSPALPAAGNIRMYADLTFMDGVDWWNAEFNVFDGKIVYRNDGGDQDAVPGTAGQVVTLMFDDNTGSIQ
jgi:hypothetical protein